MHMANLGTKEAQQLYEKTVAKGAALSRGKWARFCEGLEGNKRNFTAILLENTKQFIESMDEATRITQIGNFDKFAFPMIRAIFPNLIANEIVNVQP